MAPQPSQHHTQSVHQIIVPTKVIEQVEVQNPISQHSDNAGKIQNCGRNERSSADSGVSQRDNSMNSGCQDLLDSSTQGPSNGPTSNSMFMTRQTKHTLTICTSYCRQAVNYGSLGWPPQFQPSLSVFSFDTSLWYLRFGFSALSLRFSRQQS